MDPGPPPGPGVQRGYVVGRRRTKAIATERQLHTAWTIWFHSPMRWKPQSDRCDECDFSWAIDPQEGIALVERSSKQLISLFEGAERARQRPASDMWSPSEYLWHLVDVLRIGRERLLTITTDPTAGIPCWDENALAEIRHYGALSPSVGLIAYRSAVTEWVALAGTVPVEASVEHAQDGTMTAGDIMRRNAHEVQHHALDIRKGLQATTEMGGSFAGG